LAFAVGVYISVRLPLAVGIFAALAEQCAGMNVPQPDLSQALRASDTIVVARVLSGSARSSTAGASAELQLFVVRALEGDVASGTRVAVRTHGTRFYVPGPGSNLPRRWEVEHFTAIWFLHRQTGSYAVIPVTAGAGDPERTGLRLPEDSGGGAASSDPRRAVANEIVATLRAMAAAHGSEMRPVYSVQKINGQVYRSFGFGRFAHDALILARTLETLGDAPLLRSVHGEMASDGMPYLRAIGIAGLIADGDPAGPKQAAAEFRTLFHEAYIGDIESNLGGYTNADDPEAVRAIGRLATEYADLDVLELERGAAESLRKIHSREAMPALMALLDSGDANIGGLALSGICLFVRNAPVLGPYFTPSQVPWMQTKEPAPFRTKTTDAYCWLIPRPASWAPPEYKTFWKAWWREHESEIVR
jgi:hypothetical protein